MSIKPGLLGIATAGLIVGLTGCGSSTPDIPTVGATGTTSSSSTTTAPAPTTSSSGTESAAEAVEIMIKDFTYTVPASVAPGTKITVTNEDSQTHTVTSTTKGVFDVNVTGRGGTATFTAPDKAGSYPFICTFHGNMTGTLVVK